MRLVGMGERAIALMKQRASDRVAFGRPLAGHQAVRLDIARSRLELDAAVGDVQRLVTPWEAAAGAEAAAVAAAQARRDAEDAALRALQATVQKL